MNQWKIFRFDFITNKDINEHNPNLPKILDYLWRILIV